MSTSTAAETKVFYIAIYNNEVKPAQQLASVQHLDSFGRFTRGSVAEFMALFAGTVAERTKAGVRQSIQEQSYTFHVYARPEGVAGVIITNSDYPARIPHELLNRILDEFLTKYPRPYWGDATGLVPGSNKFPLPALEEYIKKYQDPQNADSITKIQRELDETKIVLHKTIESVLERGEKLDSLVARSDNLSAASKAFYGQAKKQNSCCVVM